MAPFGTRKYNFSFRGINLSHAFEISKIFILFNSTLEVTEVIKEKTKEQNKNSVLNSEEINYVKVMA